MYSFPFVHNSRGNVSCDYTYDAAGNILTVTENGERKLSYQYDSNSMRTKKTVDGVTTEYFLGGSSLLTQVTGNTQLDFFYDDLGNAMGFIKNGTDKYYYIRNLQNDIVGILDSSGTQVVEYAYDTWGKLESVTGAMAETIGRENPLRYRGYYYDEETGFYYLQSRYYDPETGRFLNADETVLTGQGITSGNMYAYCANNPVMNYDPSGKFAITLTTIILLGMASLITVAAAYEVGVLLQEPVQAAIDALESARLDRKAAIHNAGQQVLGGACLPNQRSNTDSKAKDKDIVTDVPKEPPKPNYQYWSAALVNKQVVQIEGLTYTQARTLASMGGDIVCADRGAAIAIVKFYPSARWDMAHGSKEEGYLNHYHLSSAHTNHIWYYGE